MYGDIINAASSALGGFSTALTNAAYAAPGKYDKQNKERIKEIQEGRLDEVGLTPEQEDELRYLGLLPERVREAEVRSRRADALASAGRTSARDLLLGEALDEERARRTRVDVDRTIRALDEQERELRRQELDQRIAFEQQRKAQMAAAVGQILVGQGQSAMNVVGAATKEGDEQQSTRDAYNRQMEHALDQGPQVPNEYQLDQGGVGGEPAIPGGAAPPPPVEPTTTSRAAPSDATSTALRSRGVDEETIAQISALPPDQRDDLLHLLGLEVG